MVLDVICGVMSNVAVGLGERLLPDRQMDVRTMAVLTLALLCATAPLELSQLAFALGGAAVYALLSSVQLSSPTARHSKAASGASGRLGMAESGRPDQRSRTLGAFRPPSVAGRRGGCVGRQVLGSAGSKQEHRLQTQQGHLADTALCFAGARWDEQVDELLGQIAPTVEGERIVQQLARVVKQALRRTMPEAEVSGFASGDLLRSAAYGVAVPEVDIVVSATPQVLAARLQGRLAPRGASAAQLDVRKLLKSAIRACTDRLVSTGGFKFRRSAFRGQEPKVTLLAPASLGICSEAIPVDFSVNSTTPLYNAALVEECGRIEPRSKALVLLVKRWAKDRGICHAAKGHLSPYAWSLLTVYFLQVGVSEGPLLPALAGWQMPHGLMVAPATTDEAEGGTTPASGSPSSSCSSCPGTWAPPMENAKEKTVGALFKDFVRFYSKNFHWHDEGVSVRTGQRSPPDFALPMHIILHEDGVTTEIGPSIEDPFESKRNLGECTTAASLARMHEELKRAEELCESEASLAELLEPWVPPERGSRPREEEEDEPEDASRSAAAAAQRTQNSPGQRWRGFTEARSSPTTLLPP